MFENPLSIGFKKNLKMNEACPVCGQPSDIEVGFYYGTGYVSYLIGILLTAITCIIWVLTIGFSFNDNRFVYWLVANSVLLILIQPWLMRFSRILWLSWFVHYDPDWTAHQPQELERTNKEHMNNW